MDQMLPEMLKENYSRVMGGQSGVGELDSQGLRDPASILSSMQPKYDIVH